MVGRNSSSSMVLCTLSPKKSLAFWEAQLLIPVILVLLSKLSMLRLGSLRSFLVPLSIQQRHTLCLSSAFILTKCPQQSRLEVNHQLLDPRPQSHFQTSEFVLEHEVKFSTGSGENFPTEENGVILYSTSGIVVRGFVVYNHRVSSSLYSIES